jgi:predicted nuclease of predicted toxin-antitoxin system
MQKAEDEDILVLASQRAAVVITLDADFHALVAVRGLRGPSVVRLRREGCRSEAVVEILKSVLVRYRSQLEEGCFISVKENRATFHRLPVGRED